MKKKYSKPEIAYEDFALSTSISAGCELETPLASYAQLCGYPLDPRRPNNSPTIFVEGAQCSNVQDDGKYNTFCYHVPYESNNLFNS